MSNPTQIGRYTIVAPLDKGGQARNFAPSIRSFKTRLC